MTMQWRMCKLLVLCVLALALATCRQTKRGSDQMNQPPPADLIVLNARIWTGDDARATADALAVRADRFVVVGDAATIGRLQGPETSVIDAHGARLTPGLIDAHVHFLGGGLQLSRVDLRLAHDRESFAAAVAEQALRLPRGEWILGGRWSTDSWASAPLPSRDWIDPVTREHPALLSRMDGHSGLANSLALHLAGIDTAGPPDPVGGTIDRDPATREPTGILREAAMELVSRLVPQESLPRQLAAIDAACREAHRHGITCVHTMSAWREVAPLSAARGDGRLTVRVRLYVSEEKWLPWLDAAKKFPNDDILRVVGFKQFMDGSLGSRTALMAAPYIDNPPDKADWRGLATAAAQDEAVLAKMCAAADAEGFSLAVHAIGDRANRDLLDLYERTIHANGRRPERRLRVEHVQHLLPEDLGRFSQLGILASMQPLHKADDARYAEQAIGPERCKTSYAFRSLTEHGATIAFGSDWPVVSLNPFAGMEAAVTGRSVDGRLFVPEQNLTMEQALHGYTTGAAAAAGDDRLLGRVATGYLADFVIFEDDPLTVEPAHLKEVRVRSTWVGGRQVWPSPD